MRAVIIASAAFAAAMHLAPVFMLSMVLACTALSVIGIAGAALVNHAQVRRQRRDEAIFRITA